RERRAIFDLLLDTEDHLADGRVLNHLTVEAGPQPQRRQIAGLVRRHHPGVEWAGVGKILAGRELMGVALKIADAAFVVAGVSGDVVPGRGAQNITARLADDEGKFAPELEILQI